MFDVRLWRLRYKKLRWTLDQPDRLALLRCGIAPSLEHADVLQGRRFASVIDVGANVGQFALFALEQFHPQHLVCIEPQPNTLDHVAWRSADAGCEFTIVAAALGDHTGVANLRKTRASDSSSLLSPTPSATSTHPGLKVRSEFEVPLQMADELFTTSFPRPLLIKIDVQGSESSVLQGASALLRNVDTVLIEVSFAQIYAGQSKPQDVIGLLLGHGFGLSAITAVPGSGTDWRLDQADLLFDRKPSV